MSKIIKVYCEGGNGSHDAFIMGNLLPYPSIIVKPIGGKKGAKSAVQALEGVSIEKTDFYLLFRDRDFDKPIPDKPTLEKMLSSYEYCSYRNTIENYLFDTKVFFDFVNQQNISELCNIKTLENVEELFIRAAENIKIYQAVRHTLGSMRSGRASFGTKWTEKSGILPERLDRESCREKALSLINSARDLAMEWTEDKFDHAFASFVAKFDDSFMENQKYLVYFQGKDFAASLVKKLYPAFPIKAYYRFAKRKFDYTNFPDLVELHELLKTEYEKG